MSLTNIEIVFRLVSIPDTTQTVEHVEGLIHRIKIVADECNFRLTDINAKSDETTPNLDGPTPQESAPK